MAIVFLILVGLAAVLPTELQAACNSTVNGRPMTPLECQIAIQVYGEHIPGRYAVDPYGNWVNLDNPQHRGNTYLDAQRRPNNTGRRGPFSPICNMLEPGCK
jgi:hypothetical protein